MGQTARKRVRREGIKILLRSSLGFGFCNTSYLQLPLQLSLQLFRVYDIDRSMYSDKLHSADKGDKTEWLEYFTDGVKYSLQSALGKYEKAIQNIKLSEKVTDREKDVIKIIQEKGELTSVDIAEKLKVSRQQAHALLSSLIDKGFVGKKGKTKSSFYFIK